MTIGPADLARLTAGKAVANTALRWLPFFLPTLAVALDASTATLAALLGLAEAAGLSTLAAGRWLDHGRERAVIIAALIAASVASLVALSGTVIAFALTAVLLGAGAGYVTVGGHAWISARVPFEKRARFIGVYEMSWAAALLVGAPIIALLISAFGWRAPFIAVAGASLLAAVGVATIDDHRPGSADTDTGSDSDTDTDVTASPVDAPPNSGGGRTSGFGLGPGAWPVIAVSATVAMAGLTTIVIAGTWLDEELGVSTGGIGLVAMAFGAMELIASFTSSAVADTVGKRRSMMLSVATVLAGLALIAIADGSRLVGGAGLLIFFLGFEYSIVTSFSLVSEASPEARGRTIGIGNAVGTVSRGVGVVSAGWLYQRFGIQGPAAVSTAAAVACLGFLLVVARQRPDLR